VQSVLSTSVRATQRTGPNGGLYLFFVIAHQAVSLRFTILIPGGSSHHHVSIMNMYKIPSVKILGSIFCLLVTSTSTPPKAEPTLLRRFLRLLLLHLCYTICLRRSVRSDSLLFVARICDEVPRQIEEQRLHRYGLESRRVVD